MCLAVPLELKSVNGDAGVVDVGTGAEADVNLALVPGAAIGDYVLVHAGFAIKLLDKAEAGERLALFRGEA